MMKYRNVTFPKYSFHPKRMLSFDRVLLYLCLAVLVCLLSSCEQNLNIEIEANDRRLLVDGEFTDDTVVHSIRLSCSGSLITGRPQAAVSGATIRVTDGIEVFDYVENAGTPGLYQTAAGVGGKGGHRYTLLITNIDIDSDGKMDSYTANCVMPVPVKFDSLLSYRGMNGDGLKVINMAYYKLFFDGPGYVYPTAFVNNSVRYGTITDRLGTGEFTRFENWFKVSRVLNPGSILNRYTSYAVDPADVKNGDTIDIVCFNLSNKQYGFLKMLDNNTNGNDPVKDNLYDQLKIPTNLPTNIEPADKAAGYFFVYSVSKIGKVFDE
jgi:hypothetical protein